MMTFDAHDGWSLGVFVLLFLCETFYIDITVHCIYGQYLLGVLSGQSWQLVDKVMSA